MGDGSPTHSYSEDVEPIVADVFSLMLAIIVDVPAAVFLKSLRFETVYPNFFLVLNLTWSQFLAPSHRQKLPWD